ncbi:hypothetical protein K505DRAFT_394809 [Melanomma pulvis-pyrius CBS 109.77]|uniref:Uncharacterized protein n=1 Tax=Melanomma pulvis-pyrius CBS 109.77 TaxID=1314802 RepID=A0A6A6WWN8_9PLEO|nr:hypothetical protein K505DRAFT_394809 [Melanomma pulvis-pyrius CBS 109.77]
MAPNKKTYKAKAAPSTTRTTAPSSPPDDVPDVITSMTIPPNTPMKFTARSPVEIRTRWNRAGLTIQADNPTLLSAPYRMELYPTADLGAAFARGWRSLPDELKLLILSFNLTLENPVTNADIRSAFNGGIADHHRRTTAEIKSMVHDVFWASNTFEVRLRHNGIGPRQPDNEVNGKIRSVKIRLEDNFTHRDVKTAVNMAWGMYGFDRLKRVDIEISWAWDQDVFSVPRPRTVEEWCDFLGGTIRGCWVLEQRGSVTFKGPVGQMVEPDEAAMVERIEEFLRTEFEFDGNP